MKRRVLVTGANGFVGGYLCPHLAENGYDVLCGVSGANVRECPSREFDLTDAASVDALVEWAKPDVVVHLAGIAYIPQAAKSPANVMDVNLNGTIRVLEATRKHAAAARVLFVGSGDAYGRPERLPMTEDQPLRPVNPYAISKAAADHYCAYAAAAGLDIVRARPFNHGGAGQSDGVVLSSFARQIAEMEAGTRPPILHVGALDTIRDFTHVSDVVRAYRLLVERGKKGEVYNICSGKSYRIQELLDGLLSLTKVRVEVKLDRERLRPVDIPEVRASHAKLHAETGWSPQVPVQTLLSDLLGYWRTSNKA